MNTLPDFESRHQARIEHVDPLIKQWHEYKNNILKLLQEYPGYLKKRDIKLVEDFLDGHIKREITEGGRNDYASRERISKLLAAIEALQKRLIP